jgi:hypothetical protein
MKTITYKQNLGPYTLGKNTMRVPVIFEKNGDIESALPGTCCREVLADNIMSLVRGEDIYLADKRRAARLMHKARVLFLNTGAPVSRIKACMRVLNMFEDKVGLSNTEAVLVKSADNSKFVNYMFVGDSTWYKSPVTISLYLLLLRFFINSGTVNKFKAMKSLADFYDFVKTDLKFVNVKDYPLNCYISGKAASDLHMVYHTHEKWEDLMSNIDRLLPKRQTWVERFAGNRICKPAFKNNKYHGTQGVKKLFTGHCNLKISDRYNALTA